MNQVLNKKSKTIHVLNVDGKAVLDNAAIFAESMNDFFTGGGGFSAKFRVGGCRPQFENVTVG